MRNCTCLRSCEKAQVLNKERSKSVRPGPLNVFRPRFPSVPSAGNEKHSVLMKLRGLPGLVALSEQPGTEGLKSGRCPPDVLRVRLSPVRAWSFVRVTVNGGPDCAVK